MLSPYVLGNWLYNGFLLVKGVVYAGQSSGEPGTSFLTVLYNGDAIVNGMDSPGGWGQQTQRSFWRQFTMGCLCKRGSFSSHRRFAALLTMGSHCKEANIFALLCFLLPLQWHAFVNETDLCKKCSKHRLQWATHCKQGCSPRVSEAF